MKPLVCNYAPIRFLPYRETGEFVNIGVVAYVPELDWLNFKLESKRKKRVNQFFPELDKTLLPACLAAADTALSRHRNDSVLFVEGGRLERSSQTDAGILRFQELIRRREALLHFGEPGVKLIQDPHAALEDLFNELVRRQFAEPKAYQEIQMRRRLASLLKEWRLPYEHDKVIGDAEFHFKMPFVHFEDKKPTKVIKPFDLDRTEPSEIYHHGDPWVAKIQRLRDRKQMPENVLFAVKFPAKSAERAAADAICHSLIKLKVKVVEFDRVEEMRTAAAIGR